MREFREREQEGIGRAPVDALQDQARHPETTFHSNAPFPEVSNETSFEPGRSASDLAFGPADAVRNELAGGEKSKELVGTYGTYTARWQWVMVKGVPSLKFELTMHADAKKLQAGSQIAFVQVTRRSSDGGKTYATKVTDAGMTEDRAKRTDQKTGFRIDRDSSEHPPFYGTEKHDGAITATSNTKIGTVGGQNAWLWDRPRALTSQDSMEFISTATDIATGQQLDAIQWGFGPNHADMTPEIIPGTDARLVGRDRAIDTWNENVAQNEGEGVPLEGSFNPTDAAQMLAQNLHDKNKDAVTMTLKNPINTKGDHRARVKANYVVETGHDLAADLKTMYGSDVKKYKDWL